MFENIINELSHRFIQKKISKKELLSELFNNQELKDKFINEIRRSTIIWQIANEIFSKVGAQDNCKVMAIWDVKYFWEILIEWENLVKNSLSSINIPNLIWYDLSGQWTIEFRWLLMDYMNNYYNLSSLDKNKIIDSIIPTYGGTDWFASVLDTIKQKYADKNVKFIYPEASFLANVKIAESFLWERNLIKINKPDSNNFFFDTEWIKDLYKNTLSQNDLNIYYITPVGNPTWNKINSENFIDVIRQISDIDNDAIFIFDTVYVWILRQETSAEMFREIFHNKEILDKIIFTESLSKTLWTTGLRIGWIWTYNEIFSQELKKNMVLKKAGYSKILNEFGINLLSDFSQIITFQNKIYEFWSRQRKWFFELVKHEYSRFFDLWQSPEIFDREWMYVLLKVKDWFEIEEIFAEMWIIGVWIKLSDWLYIRYAIWNVNYF